MLLQRFLQIVYNRNSTIIIEAIYIQLLESKDLLEKESMSSKEQIIIKTTYITAKAILFVFEVGIIWLTFY